MILPLSIICLVWKEKSPARFGKEEQASLGAPLMCYIADAVSKKARFVVASSRVSCGGQDTTV
jgi:hypothetical protein